MARFLTIVLMGWFVVSKAVWAQNSSDVVWVQIEAQPTLEEALDRIEVYSRDLPDVNGFAMPGGWFSITLGPYVREDAELLLRSFRATGRIPSDSYIALNSAYRSQYWPEGSDLLNLGTLALPQSSPEASQIETVQVQETEPSVQPGLDPETATDARRSEALLSRQEKQDLQVALAWAGVYNAGIDGSFGRGTRNAMSAWQSLNGFEPTGILTTRQRALLLERYNAPLEGLGLKLVRDQAAGIEIKMPTALVKLDRYASPFADYMPTEGNTARVLLISQSGDRATLASLFEIMQTLEIVPLEGPRRLDRNSFTLVGRNNEFISETRAKFENGTVKGFTLIWPAGDEERRTRVLSEMNDSFATFDGVIDPSLGTDTENAVDLVAGLALRKPKSSRSGFFVAPSGAVVTTASAVTNCTRITLDSLYDVTLSTVDAESGIAVLEPQDRLSPPTVAEFSTTEPRIASEIAVSGYSFEGQLASPSLTFGTVSDVKGLTGETDRSRLLVRALPGDEGGPVLDYRGQVMGMLMPQPDGSRQLPDEVRFAITSATIKELLSRAGVTPIRGGGNTDALDPIDITDRGVGMTVLVSCWG